MSFQTRIAVLSALTVTSMMAMADPAAPYPGYGYGPGMMWQQQMTPEQWQQRWETMRQQGYGPGMMHQNMSPQQYQQWWEQMQRQGYGPGMMMGPSMMGPGMMGPGHGPGMSQFMTPEQYKQWYEHMRQRFAPPVAPAPSAPAK